MIKCRLCGLEHGQITYAHLRFAHNLTTDDYRRMFPDAPLAIVSEETAQGIAKTLTGRTHSEETKQKMSKSHLGKTCIPPEEEGERAVRRILRKKEYMRQYQPKYYQVPGHRAERAESMRRWNEEHVKEVAEYNRRWAEKHPRKRTEYGRKRRALEVGSNGNFTPEEFELLCEVFGYGCIYCKQKLPLVPDHAIPISRGGSNSIENIVPSCALCNQRKHTMTYDEFLERCIGR